MTGKELKDRLKYLGYTPAAAAKALGITPQDINSKFISGDIKTGFVQKLAAAINATVYDLMSETAPNAKSVSPNTADNEGELSEPTDGWKIKEAGRKEITVIGKHAHSRLAPDEYAEAFGDWPGLPIFNEPITASFVATFRDTSAHVPQYYLHDPRFRDCDFGAIITGDSMHPEIRHGDIVACKLINDTTFIVFGDIYYIVAANGLETCKYVQRVKTLREGAEKRGRGGSKARYDDADVVYDDEKVLLVPYNTAIDPSPILKSMIERLYKVRGIIRGY